MSRWQLLLLSNISLDSAFSVMDGSFEWLVVTPNAEKCGAASGFSESGAIEMESASTCEIFRNRHFRGSRVSRVTNFYYKRRKSAQGSCRATSTGPQVSLSDLAVIASPFYKELIYS